MKKMTKILEKADISPRDRIMLNIRNWIHYNKTGMHALNETERYNLFKRWRPKDEHEQDEYNKYWHVWDEFRRLEIDMQTFALNTYLELAHLEKLCLMMYYIDDKERAKETWHELRDKSEKPAIEYVLENTGLEYKQLVHTYTFLSLSPAMQKKILDIDEYARHDYMYLLEEENTWCKEVEDVVPKTFAKTIKTWINKKKKVELEIQRYIDEGMLVRENHTRYIGDREYSVDIITGKSLYEADESLPFVSNFKTQADSLEVYGYLLMLFETQEVESWYGQLLGYKDIIFKLSDVVGEPVSECADKYLRDVDEALLQINQYLRGIIHNIDDYIHIDGSHDFPLITFFDAFFFDMSRVQSQENKFTKLFNERAGNYLRSEWKTIVLPQSIQQDTLSHHP